MQRVKRRFFAMRNGALAAQMDAHGKKYKINFGLNIPQISEIARDFIPGGTELEGLKAFDQVEFARLLRANDSTRESMLIAPMLFPPEALTEAEARSWMMAVATPEVADVLMLKLLRNYSEAPALLSVLEDAGVTELQKYAGLRLLLNLLQIGRLTAEDVRRRLAGSAIVASPMTSSLLRQIDDELQFLTES